MGFFQKVREMFGVDTGEENPVDTYDSILFEEAVILHQIQKAQEEFDEISDDLSLKRQACDVLISKGNPDGEFNKKIIEDRMDAVTLEYLELRKSLDFELNEVRGRKSFAENDLIEKATEFVATLSDPKQAYIRDLMVEWTEHGTVDGEEISSHTMAIIKALDLSTDGEFQKAVAAEVGEVRTWSGRKFQKTSNGWVELKKDRKGKREDDAKERESNQKPEKRHSAQELATHAENTSTEQLEKVAKDASKDPHIRDAAKRELERRNAEKDKEQRKWGREDEVKEREKKEQADAAAKEEAEKSAQSDTQKPKRKKKKELPVPYAPSEYLSPEHSKIEKRFGKYLNTKFKEAKIRYKAKFGNVLNTDNARELSDDYESNRAELSAAVHEPASAFIKKVYAEMLAEPVPKGKRNKVLFTAGGTGAGKTTGIQNTMKKDLDNSHIIFDTNMNGYESSVKKIEQALSAGKNVKIAYTFRDPVDAFENGAVPRSIRIGRTVPIVEHVKTHLGALDTMLRIHDKYKGNKKVQISVIDNSRGAGKAALADMEFVKKKNKLYNAAELREQLHRINNSLYEQGKITESHYRGFKGNE